MGAALGGGAAETVFGGESANVLSKMTTTLTVILFVLSFGLYLGFVAREKPSVKALDAAATAAPAAPAAAAAAPAAPAAPAPVTAPAAKPQSTPAPAATTPAKPAAPAPAK
jgi:preprotein translocase subunit SecG